MTTSARASQARSITSHTVNNGRSHAKCSLSDFTLHPPPTSIILPAPPRSGQLSGVRPCIQTRNCSGESPADGGWGRGRAAPIPPSSRQPASASWRSLSRHGIRQIERPMPRTSAVQLRRRQFHAHTHKRTRQTDRQTGSAETPPPIIILYTLASSVVLSNGIGH